MGKTQSLGCKMILKLVLALCVTITLGDYVIPGIGIPGRYPARPPPMMPVEEDTDAGTGQWVWIPSEEVEDDSDIEEVPEVISGLTPPEEIENDSDTEEIPEVVPGASSSRRRRYVTTTKSTEGRRRRNVPTTKSTDGRRRRNVTATKSTGGRRRRGVTTTEGTDGRRRRGVTTTNST